MYYDPFLVAAAQNQAAQLQAAQAAAQAAAAQQVDPNSYRLQVNIRFDSIRFFIITICMLNTFWSHVVIVKSFYVFTEWLAKYYGTGSHGEFEVF